MARKDIVRRESSRNACPRKDKGPWFSTPHTYTYIQESAELRHSPEIWIQTDPGHRTTPGNWAWPKRGFRELRNRKLERMVLHCQPLPGWVMKPVGQRPRSATQWPTFFWFSVISALTWAYLDPLSSTLGSELALNNCFVGWLQVRFVEATCGSLRRTASYSALGIRGYVSRDLMGNSAWGWWVGQCFADLSARPAWVCTCQFQLSPD